MRPIFFWPGGALEAQLRKGRREKRKKGGRECLSSQIFDRSLPMLTVVLRRCCCCCRWSSRFDWSRSSSTVILVCRLRWLCLSTVRSFAGPRRPHSTLNGRLGRVFRRRRSRRLVARMNLFAMHLNRTNHRPIVLLPARRYASAGLCDSDVSVRPSVRLSAARRYCA